MTKKSVGVLCVASILGATVGGLVGWFVRGGWTAPWVAAAGSWAGATASFLAVSTALWIALRDGRQARHDRLLSASKQARNVLTEPHVRGHFAFTVTNYSDAPIRNVLLETVAVAWKAETKKLGRPNYHEIKWGIDPERQDPPIPAVPLVGARESHQFNVHLDTGMPHDQARQAIAAFRVTLSLTDIDGARWRNSNGTVTLVKPADLPT